MVGVPKTRGCENCRKRKKKCGEEWPACSLCISAGWKCPGYPRRWTFVAEDARLAAYFSKKKYIYEYAEVERASSEAGSECLHWQGTAHMNLSVENLSSRNDTLATNLLYHMASQKSQALLPLATYGTFFQFIPNRLGRNRALDASVACLCGAFSDLLLGNQSPSRPVLHQYSQALYSLQASLDDAGLRFQAETLCASIVLNICELMINRDDGRWQRLAKGTTFLIQSRGPGRYVSAFDLAMLESQQISIIAHSASSLAPCFLVQPEWQRLVRCSTPPAASNESLSISLRIKLCQFLAQLPGLVSSFKALFFATSDPLSVFQTEQRGETTQLLDKALSIHETIQTWYTTELEPYVAFPSQVSGQAESQFPDSRNPTAARHGSILMVILKCAANSILLNIEQLIWILNQALSPGFSTTVPAEFAHIKPEIPLSFNKRRQQIYSSFEFVKKESPLSAKPLEFGISRLCLFENIFERLRIR